ncbi:MAG: hypothetical protein QXU98_04075 [Candidatus Parvarchaeota archaeon]
MTDISEKINEIWRQLEIVRNEYYDYIKDMPIGKGKQDARRAVYKVSEDMENILSELRELSADEIMAEETHDMLVSKKQEGEFII